MLGGERSEGEAAEKGKAGGAPIAAKPISIAPAAVPTGRGVHLEYSACEAESDEVDVEGLKSTDVVVCSAAPNLDAKAAEPRHATSSSSSSDSSSSGTSTKGSERVAAEAHSDNPGGSSSSDGASYFVSQEDPEAIVKELGFGNARLFGEQRHRCIDFSCSKTEKKLLEEAGSSFCFPIAEKELMGDGARFIVCDAKNLALKSYLALHCAERELSTADASALKISSVEERIGVFEK